ARNPGRPRGRPEDRLDGDRGSPLVEVVAQLAAITAQLTAIGTALALVAPQLATVPAQLRPILPDRLGIPGTEGLPQRHPDPPQLAPVAPDFPVILTELAPVPADLLDVLPDLPPVLRGCLSAGSGGPDGEGDKPAQRDHGHSVHRSPPGSECEL